METTYLIEKRTKGGKLAQVDLCGTDARVHFDGICQGTGRPVRLPAPDGNLTHAVCRLGLTDAEAIIVLRAMLAAVQAAPFTPRPKAERPDGMYSDPRSYTRTPGTADAIRILAADLADCEAR